MKKIILSLGILFLAISSSVFAADTFVSAKYMDFDEDGTVDRIRILFDEDTGVIGYESEDWTINTAGDINISITGAFGEGDTALILRVDADSGETGGLVNPVISYNNNDGDDSIMLASGPLSAKANMEVTDDAKPFVTEVTPVATPAHYKKPEIVLHFSEEIDSLFNETVGCMITQSNLPSGNNNLIITKDGLGTDMDNGTWDCKIKDITDKSPAANVLAGPFSFSQFVIEDNEDPEITSNGGGNSAAINSDENQTAVTTVTATDPNAGDSIAYAILDGADWALFNLDANSGDLTFAAAPDFENPTDANGDNVYEVRVRATDGTTQDVQSILVTVIDVNESKGHSGKSHKATSSKKVCKDTKATNFSNV